MYALPNGRDVGDKAIIFGGFCQSGFCYQLKIAGPSGELIREEYIRAFTDREAVDVAIQRLARAAMVEVWSDDQLVCQLYRRTGLH
jgi:hypothetical protein